MGKAILAEGEYYHIYSRGVRKNDIFHNQRDFTRFLFLILHCQGDYSHGNIGYAVTDFVKTGKFRIQPDTVNRIISSRFVELVAFGLMDNHVHLAILEKREGGISKFMQRVLNAYAKYYNEKYKQTGHVFQGRFGRVHVSDNTQFLHLSAYIHKNPSDIGRWRGREEKYPWSSLQDYVGENRWPGLLVPGRIMEQFDSPEEYQHFVRTSSAKSLPNDLLLDI